MYWNYTEYGIHLLVPKFDYLSVTFDIPIQRKQDSHIFSRFDIIGQYSSNYVDAIEPINE